MCVNLKKPVCPKCKKNPCNYNAEQDLWEYCTECKVKMKQKDIGSFVVSCGVPQKYANYSLANFNKEKVDKLREESQNWAKNIIFDGDSFVGKTVFLSGICKEILLRTTKNIVFLNCVDVLTLIKNEELFWEYAKKATMADILILDDIIKPEKSYEYKWLYMVLNNRSDNGKTTHGSTNMKLDVELDARLYSRLVNNGFYITLDKSSWKV